MVSSRLVVAAVLMIFNAAVSSSSQTTSEKAATASISGKVRIKDKAVAGVVVFAEEQNSRGWRQRSNYRGTTDQEGNYRITNVRAGTYAIRPVAPSLAREDYVTNNVVVINEGETVEDINFSLVPGGVITGKISDPDGKPLVEESVNIVPIDPATYVGMQFEGNLHTDDRGIYRAFGLYPGKYKVSVGQNESLPGERGSFHRQTFYPSVTDDAKATVIEVAEGSETANIDIVVGRPVSTFRVGGRILDSETGKPLVHIKYGVSQRHGDSGSSSRVGGDYTNANGEFRLDNVLPGKYVVFIVPGDSGVRGDHVAFEVVDRDLTDLVIKAGKAATVAGVVAFENGDEPKPRFKFNELFISGWGDGGQQQFAGPYSSQVVKPDGSFTIGDLQQGKVRFVFNSPIRNDYRQLQLVRVERDGVVQPGGLILKDGEHVTGVRLIVKLLTGVIHGQIKFEGDEVPASHMSIWLSYLDDNKQGESFSMGNSSPQLDSRKRFTVEGLAAGNYEVNVALFGGSAQYPQTVFKQQVTVVENAASDVTITIKPKP
ncbi:MAG TPA: carboxypeptidase-like regulatory domain-containing protein [Pyrinomonadaceae bacterium]|nr:carboxypeptidase-like regulatory domain-containing protein [Pyrinomonadaceae bacterium]